MTKINRLSRLKVGQSADILAIHSDDVDLVEGLREQGLVPGTNVEVLERGLIGGTPLAVRVGRAIIAMRRREAEVVEVGAA